MKLNLADLEAKARAEENADQLAMQAFNDGADVAVQRAAWYHRDAARAVLRSEMTPPVVLALVAIARAAKELVDSRANGESADRREHLTSVLGRAVTGAGL